MLLVLYIYVAIAFVIGILSYIQHMRVALAALQKENPEANLLQHPALTAVVYILAVALLAPFMLPAVYFSSHSSRFTVSLATSLLIHSKKL